MCGPECPRSLVPVPGSLSPALQLHPSTPPQPGGPQEPTDREGRKERSLPSGSYFHALHKPEEESANVRERKPNLGPCHKGKRQMASCSQPPSHSMASCMTWSRRAGLGVERSCAR